jgi:hypothetical protein
LIAWITVKLVEIETDVCLVVEIISRIKSLVVGFFVSMITLGINLADLTVSNFLMQALKENDSKSGT